MLWVYECLLLCLLIFLFFSFTIGIWIISASSYAQDPETTAMSRSYGAKEPFMLYHSLWVCHNLSVGLACLKIAKLCESSSSLDHSDNFY